MNKNTTLAIVFLMAGALLTTIATTMPDAEAYPLIKISSSEENDQGENNFNNQQSNSDYICFICV